MNNHPRHCNGIITHHVVCQHQIEVEVWPAQAEVYFQQEAHVDPANTQARFDAVVYNAPTSNIHWEVMDIAGNSGAGTIDQTGLYTAPPMGPHDLTDIVVATAMDDPMRQAFAAVTLMGFGPAPTPDPKIEIFPKRAYVYYPGNQNNYVFNEYIDVSNTKCLLRAYIQNSDSDQVQWNINSSWHKPWYIYEATGSGSNNEIDIEVSLQSDPSVKDHMKLFLINYQWPGIA